MFSGGHRAARHFGGGILPGLFKRKKAEQPLWCTAVVVAAGSSTRMGGVNKIMLPLREEPVILHTLRVLECCACIQEIIVVTREELIVPISRLCADYALSKVRKIVLGGETRAHSVYQGVSEASDRARLIAIHDGARPLVSEKVVQDAVSAAAKCGAAAPAIPVKDTIKRAVKGVVQETPDRAQLFAVQTPQVFEADLIRAALFQAIQDGAPITDDCSAVERLGARVTLTAGSEENIKITTPGDVMLAEAIMAGREEA